MSKKPEFKDRLKHLSDYWAQEMIGADLLKEKLTSSARKHFIAVFDTFYMGHDVAVKNLISGEGRQAVLPGGNHITPIMLIELHII